MNARSPKGRLQVCILTQDPGPSGGVARLASTMYSMLERWGHDPFLLYVSMHPEDRITRDAILTRDIWRARPRTRRGLRGIAVSPILSRLGRISLALSLPAMRGYIDRADMVVVVAGSSHIGLPVALLGKRFICWVATTFEAELQAKIVAGDQWAARTLRSKSWPLVQYQEQLVFHRATLILALSQYTAANIERLCPKLKSKVQTSLFPIDTRRFSPNRSGSQSSSDGRTLLCVARLNDPRKNVALLLRALALVKTQFPKTKLMLVGDAPTSELVTLCDELGLQNHVSFEGRVSDDGLVALYRRADLFVLPSLQEGLGIVVGEALACGLPVIATRCGGPEDLVVEGETGLLVRNNEPEDLARGIRFLIQNDSTRERMSRNAVWYARHHLSCENVEKILRDSFRSVYPEFDV